MINRLERLYKLHQELHGKNVDIDAVVSDYFREVNDSQTGESSTFNEIKSILIKHINALMH